MFRSRRQDYKFLIRSKLLYCGHSIANAIKRCKKMNFTIKEIQDRAEEGILEIAKKYHLQALTLRFILLSRNLGTE